MDLPNTVLTLASGPVRELRAVKLTLVSSFLMRDRWQINLPQRTEVRMADGKTLLLETRNGQVMWRKDSGQLTLRAEELRLLDMGGNQVARLGDLVLERRMNDANVRIDLASRPTTAAGEAVLSGHMTMPAVAFSNILKLFGSDHMPTVGAILGSLARDLQRGGELEMENVSFKSPRGGPSGAVYGTLRVLSDGRTTGNVVVTADSAPRTYGWLTKAQILAPRNVPEMRGVARFSSGLAQVRGTVRMQNMQDTLMLNGQPVGPLPMLADVVNRLWN
jgi:hypothetical protein